MVIAPQRHQPLSGRGAQSKRPTPAAAARWLLQVTAGTPGCSPGTRHRGWAWEEQYWLKEP